MLIMKILICFIIFLQIPIYSQSKEEIIRMQTEDALIEIMVKEKQKEIEEEKRIILEEEAEYLRLHGYKNKNYYYDFFVPGLGHFFRENYLKSFLFGTGFWAGVYFVNFHYLKAKHYSKKIQNESIYNPFSFQLLPIYKYHNQQSQLFSVSTLGVYILNLFISFQDNSEFEVSFLSKKENQGLEIYELKLTFYF